MVFFQRVSHRKSMSDDIFELSKIDFFERLNVVVQCKS